VYAAVQDFRDEGITEAQASDARLLALIEEATAAIDRITGWFFEPREMTVYMNGRGKPSIEPPYPPIDLVELTVNERLVNLDNGEVVIIGAPVQPGFSAPRITLKNGNFYVGAANVVGEGVWGFTEDDGTPYGRTPLAIRRACMMLVMRMLPFMGNADDTADAKNAWRIIEEKTRDQSYKLDKPSTSWTITGDPEIDLILERYSKPMGLGAA
jgi:hypothetical protein